jgi:RNA polymerase sigma-70 factor (ECF subfamily)
MPSKTSRWKNGVASALHVFDKVVPAPLETRPVDKSTHKANAQDPSAGIVEAYDLATASDEMLASRIAARDMQAFSAIYDRFSQSVFSMAGHMLGVNEAEEAAQEIFMRLWNKASQYDPARGPFSHWFMSIARNHMLDKLRARSERMRVVAAEEIDSLLAEAADPKVDVVDQVWQKQRGDALLGALQRIPAEQRRVIVLAYFGGMSQSEISMHINVPLGTVKKRIRLGLQKMRAALSPHALLDIDWQAVESVAEVES